MVAPLVRVPVDPILGAEVAVPIALDPAPVPVPEIPVPIDAPLLVADPGVTWAIPGGAFTPTPVAVVAPTFSAPFAVDDPGATTAPVAFGTPEPTVPWP